MNEGIYPVDQVGDKLASLRRIIFGSELNYVGYLPKLGKIKKRGIAMLIEYIEEALKRAHYEIIDGPDEPYYGEVPELPGVWANAKTLEACRENLKEVVEGWILLSIKKALPLPKLGDMEIKEIQEEAA